MKTQSDVTILKEVSYKFIPQNEKYYNITFEDKETQEKHKKLWNEILEKGVFIKNEFAFNFIVSTYEYNDKYYQLWYNDNYGYNDHIKEYTR